MCPLYLIPDMCTYDTGKFAVCGGLKAYICVYARYTCDFILYTIIIIIETLPRRGTTKIYAAPATGERFVLIAFSGLRLGGNKRDSHRDNTSAARGEYIHPSTVCRIVYRIGSIRLILYLV